MRLALDAMGGDHAPKAPVEGALLFAKDFPQHEVVLVGREAAIREVAGSAGLPNNVRVHAAADVIGMEDNAGAAIRRKRDASLRVCFDLVKSGAADAVISAGHSGAMMAGALLVLGRLEGVERPAFGTFMPSLGTDAHGENNRCLLIDAGAVVECKASHLAQFAVMGSAYVRSVRKVAQPRVGILSNGEEEGKGTELTREAWSLLKGSDLNFVGNVEGQDIFSGKVDVVVTDGFTGNVVLKTSEGAAMAVVSLIKSGILGGGLLQKLAAWLLKPIFRGVRDRIDYAEYGGAPVLGVPKVAVVAHGRSCQRAVKNALRAAMQTVDAGLIEELERSFQGAQSWLPGRLPPRAEEQAQSV